jgi:hypothetical protein
MTSRRAGKGGGGGGGGGLGCGGGAQDEQEEEEQEGQAREAKGAPAPATTVAQDDEEEHDGPTTEEAAAVAPLPAAESECDAVAPPRVHEVLEAREEEEEAADKDDCPVCLQPLGAEGGEEKGVLIMCGHEYHETCLDAWVSTCVRKRLDVTCPSCRAPVSR